MQDQAEFSSIQEIQEEQISPAEVREILERLAVHEFGDGISTLGSLAEGVGASPLVVARILGDIRKRNLDELFGARLNGFEQRITENEVKVTELSKERHREDEVEREMREIAEERIRQRALFPYLVGLMFVVLLYGLFTTPIQCSCAAQ